MTPGQQLSENWKLDIGNLELLRMLATEVDVAVAAAVASEREECAKIANEYAKRAWAAFPSSAQEAAVAAETIANAIRNRT